MNKSELEAEVARLQKELAKKSLLLREAVEQLNHSVRLVENWAHGPVFKRAGVIWPNNTCNSPAYVNARKWLRLYYQGND